MMSWLTGSAPAAEQSAVTKEDSTDTMKSFSSAATDEMPEIETRSLTGSVSYAPSISYAGSSCGASEAETLHVDAWLGNQAWLR